MPPQTEKLNGCAKIEAVLRQHPGVRAARACGDNPGREQLIAYVVPRDEYFAMASTDAAEEGKRVQRWRKTFDLTQMAKEVSAPEPDFNIAGWNSSYTKQPIPAHEMREWVDNTVAEISALQPQETLEIGCGSGLLLLRLAPKSKRYVGTDLAPAVLAKLRKQMQQMSGSWDAVELLERPADNFDGLPEASFDTVVINSVTHYFPNVTYLAKVMDGAARVLKPGGNIFIGDVRSLPLLEAYAASVELFQAANEMDLAELRARVTRRINQEEQLVISPALFLELAQRNPKLSRAEIRLKRGRSDNELTRFRYDVVLHAGGKQDRNTKLEWSDWGASEQGIEEIRQRLKNEKPAAVAITGIRNARVEKDIAVLARLSSADVKGTVGQLKRELDKAASSGLRPEDLCAAGEAAGYGVQLSWAGCHPDGRYDAFLWRSDGGVEERKPITWPQPSPASAEFTRHTNVPGQSVFRERLVQNLLSYCKENLPEDLVPGTLLVVDALPS